MHKTQLTITQVMKPMLLSVLIISLIAPAVLAQEQAKKVGWDERHADEPAVNLFNSYDVVLHKDGSYTESIHIVRRIQNERAMSLGEIPITYDKKFQSVKKIKAYISAPDGRRYRYKKIQDVDTSVEAYYSDRRKKIITMPNVVADSTIDLEYEIFNKQGPIKGEYFLVMGMFDYRPMKHQIITLSAPEDTQLYLQYKNTTMRPEISRIKGRIIYKWETKDDECYDEDLINEDYQPASVDFMPYTCISTMKDWDSLAAWVREIYAKNIVSSDEIKAAVNNITKGTDAPAAKIEAIMKYLRDNFRYVSMTLDEHNFEPHPAAEVFKNKFGDCKDQSILLITMLKELGIEAYPVLLRDLSGGDISGFPPYPLHFNHVIAAINLNGKLYFADPLIEGYRLGEIPAELEGDYVFVANDKRGEFMQLPFMDLKQKTQIKDSDVYLRQDGSAVVESKVTPDRYDSIKLRKAIKLATRKSREDFLSYLENLTRGGKIIDYSTEGQDDEYGFLIVKLKADYAKYTKPYGSIMIFGHTSIELSEDFFQKERKSPIWLSDESQDIDINEYIIPEGFEFEYIPENVNFNSEWIDTCVTYKQEAKNVRQEKRLHFKRALIPASRYKEYKDFLQKVENELNECIIIRKADKEKIPAESSTPQ